MFDFLVKKCIFDFYVWYQLKSPIKKGNAFFGRLIKHFNPINYTIDGLLLKLNPVSYIDLQLIAYKTHDNEVKKWIDNYLKPDELFLDIGANIGYFSIYAAKIKNARVISFEPSKRELSRFYENIALNQLNNIIVFPFALGQETMRIGLNISDLQNPGKNSIVHDDDASRTETIHVDILGKLLSTAIIEKIKLIKIDVEGYEVNVLMGLSSIINLLDNAIFIVEITSYINRDSEMKETHKIYNFFKEHGFKAQIGIKHDKQYNEIFIKKNENSSH